MPVNDLSPTDPDSACDKRPVPVILASDPLGALWPHSLLENPWRSRRFGDGRSAVERKVDVFARTSRFRRVSRDSRPRTNFRLV